MTGVDGVGGSAGEARERGVGRGAGTERMEVLCEVKTGTSSIY